MARVLLISTVSRQFHLFERANIALLDSMGHEIHAAANYSDASHRLDGLPIVRHHIDAARSPLSLLRNLRSLVQLVRLIRRESIEAIHCHAPVGGVLGRVAGRLTGVRPVIYTAHGFHFHKGASLTAWALFYPVERLFARWTDVLITINEEDYERAQRFKASRVVRVPGVGVQTDGLTDRGPVDRERLRASLGVSGEALLLISVGELNANKNHALVVRAMALLPSSLEASYVICGSGPLDEDLTRLADKLGVRSRLILLGYRDDVPSLLGAADIFIHPSFREGLPVSLLEAMVTRLSCIVSDVRGNSELIEQGKGGWRVHPRSEEEMASAISSLADGAVREEMGERNRRIALNYSVQEVDHVMADVYATAIPHARNPPSAPSSGSDLGDVG